MTFSPSEMPQTFAHKIASIQSRAWLPPAILLLALSSAFLFGSGERSYFYRDGIHNWHSAKHLAIAENLSVERYFLMFYNQTLDADGKPAYEPYNRFPIGGYALIKLATLPFGESLSAKIYAARTLMLLCFASAAALAYLSLRRLASSRWIALTAALLAFSSAYCLYYSDIIQTEAMIDLFAIMLVFHGMAVFEQEGRFRQLLAKTCMALLLGWHAYALLLPFIVFGLTRELIKTRSSISTSPLSALCQLKRAALSLLRSRYLALGAVALIFGISVLTFNFTNEYFALNRETSLTELPSFKSMTKRTGAHPRLAIGHADYLSWPAFPERQFYRIGVMSLPYAFSPSFVEYSTDAPHRLLVMLGIVVSGASLIGLLFVRRYKILMASLAVSGFCWGFQMRYATAFPWHNFEALFYIGVTLTLFSLVLLFLRRLSGERLIVALSVAALLVFALSVLRMSQLNNANQAPELRESTIADSEIIRDMTRNGSAIFVQKSSGTGFERKRIRIFSYYLTGRVILYENEILPSAISPDFIVTSERLDGLASLTPQNRMIFLYEWDDYYKHIDETIEQSSEALIRSDFDVYLNGNALIYVKDACRMEDISEKFFLALYPADESDLPQERRRSGFANLDFQENSFWRSNERCVAIFQLPDYDIVRIYTGQFVQRADGSFEHLWEGEIHLTEAAH